MSLAWSLLLLQLATAVMAPDVADITLARQQHGDAAERRSFVSAWREGLLTRQAALISAMGAETAPPPPPPPVDVCFGFCEGGFENHRGPCNDTKSRGCCESHATYVKQHKVCECTELAPSQCGDSSHRNTFKEKVTKCWATLHGFPPSPKPKTWKPLSCKQNNNLACYLCLADPLNAIRLGRPKFPDLNGADCTEREKRHFCDPAGPNSGTLSLQCLHAFNASFGTGKGKDKELDMFEGFGSWGTHVGDMGHYYQCNALEGFHYWTGHMYEQSPSPGTGGRRKLRGGRGKGKGGRGKGGGGGQKTKTVSVCLPAACSNQPDARALIADYTHYGLYQYQLDLYYATEPRAPALDTGANVVIGFAGVCAVLCIIATLLRSSWLTTCQAAMPMEEDIAKRLSALHSKYPAHAASTQGMSQLEQWRWIQAMEGPDPSVGAAAGSIQATGGGSSAAVAKLDAPLLARAAAAPNAPPREPLPERMIRSFIACWDLGANWRTGLMKKDGGVPEMRVLNGLRVLSMGWVVLCHGFLYQEFEGDVQNTAYVYLDVSRRFISTLLPNGNFSVDTFFTLSGYLGAYVGLRKLAALDRKGKKQPNPVALFFTYVLERWLRLTPAYAFVLVFYMYVIPRIMTGPQASAHVDDGQPPESNGNRDFLFCQHYVWTNLLYISNLFPLHDGTFESHYGKQGAGGAFGLEDAHGGMGCMGHSWYLSNDFQMHLLLPWILVAFRKHALLAYTGIAALIIFNWSYLGYIVAEFHWSLGCSDRGFEGSQNSLYYAKPWCRMSSFLVGVLMALYQTQHVTRSGHLPPPGLLLMGIGYVVALGIMFVCVFTPYWDTSHDPDAFMSNECQWSHAYDTIYSIFCRTAWGASICWLIFASLTCQGGPITRFLSWSFWTPFARLTYCWYLLHPLLMGVIYFAMPDGDDYYDLLGVAFYCFNTLIGLLCAAVVFFLVEMPFSNLKLLCMPAIYKGLGQLARRVSGVGSRRGGGGDGSRSAIPSFA